MTHLAGSSPRHRVSFFGITDTEWNVLKEKVLLGVRRTEHRRPDYANASKHFPSLSLLLDAAGLIMSCLMNPFNVPGCIIDIVKTLWRGAKHVWHAESMQSTCMHI